MRLTGANDASNLVRRQKAQAKRDLLAGTLTLADILHNPPACYAQVPTITILLSLPRFGPKRLANWNGEAVRRGMNLALPPAQLSTRTRDWLIDRDSQRNVTNVGRAAA
jgi:hypothetical protein